MKQPPPKPIYPLDSEVEMAAVLAMCSEPKFYSAVGFALDADRMKHPAARVLVQAVHVISGKLKSGPGWQGTVVQHLTTLMSRGKVTLDDLETAKDYLIEAAMLPAVPVEELISIVAPVIQRVVHRETIVAIHDGFKNNQSPTDAADMLAKVGKIGTMPHVIGGDLAEEIELDDIFRPDNDDDLLRLGVQEVDDALGGMERQSLLLFVGGSGSGKSMALAHAAVEAFCRGEHVFFVTLELSKRRTYQRILRNICELNRREMELDPGLARARFKAWAAQGGKIKVFEAEPIATGPKDIKRMLENAMKEDPSYHPRVLVVDFLDKIRTDPKASLYEDMLASTDGLRALAVQREGWMLTASQGTRKIETSAWPELDAIADSMNKIRSADAVITIGRTQEDKDAEQIRFNIPKRREGEGAHSRVGPIAWDPEHGRIAVISHRVNPW